MLDFECRPRDAPRSPDSRFCSWNGTFDFCSLDHGLANPKPYLHEGADEPADLEEGGGGDEEEARQHVILCVG